MYCKMKNNLIKEIENKCKELNIDDLQTIVKEIDKKDTIYITDYVTDLMKKNGFGCTDVFTSQEVIKAFEHELRAICLELGYHSGSKTRPFRDIKADSEYIESMCELSVDEQDLDFYIHEKGSVFNPSDLAYAIFQIYCGKVVFKK